MPLSFITLKHSFSKQNSSPTEYVFSLPPWLTLVTFSSVCTKFNLYDNDIVFVCLGKSSFVKSFINSIVIVRFFVSPADKISPSLTSFPFWSVTLNVRYLCCSCVNTVFSILSIFALIVPLFTKSTVYTTLSNVIFRLFLLIC